MKRCCVILSLLLLAVVLPISTYAVPRLGADVTPTSQLIDLNLDPALADYSGRVEIDLQIHKSVNSFTLYAEQIPIDSIFFFIDKKPVPVSFQPIENIQLEITATAPLPTGDATLIIYFHNDFNTQAVSLYRMDMGEKPYLFSQMEADEAREAFPCFDEPNYKIPYQVVLTVPAKYTAISNMPVDNQTPSGNNIRYRFKQSPPMSSYLLAIAVGSFDLIDIPDMPIPTRIVTPVGEGDYTTVAQEVTPKLIHALIDYFGINYPYEKLDLIAVPEFWPGAMENPGAITFAEGILVFDPNSATLGQKRRLITVAAHELAHMWFGDLVTMEWWDDLWLNESFATWMGNKISQQVFPDYGVDISRVGTSNAAMIGDARPSSVAIRQPIEETAELLSNIGSVYYKGQNVLGMFEQYVGEEAFQKGIRRYLNTYSWKNATAADLWLALEKESGKSVSKAMATFIEQPGVPLVMISQNEDGSIIVHQQRFSNYGVMQKAEYPWQIPLNVKYASKSGVKTASVLLTSNEQKLDLPSDGNIKWIMPNLDAGGYYRWTAPPDMMLAMAKNSLTLLSPQERVNFIGNLSALLDAGVIDGGAYLDLLGYFANDNNSQVLSILIGAIDKVKNAFIVDDHKKQFAVYVDHYLKPLLDRVGMEKQDGEDETVSLIRPNLIGYLAYEAKDKEVLTFVKDKFNAYMADPTSVDPAIAGVVVSLACVDGDQALFDDCKQRFETTQTPRERARFLSALGHFEDTTIQKEALEYSLEGPLRPQEIWTIPSNIASVSEERADYIFNWTINHIDEIKGKMPPVYHMYLPYLAGGCSQERLKKAKEYFNHPENFIEGAAQQLRKVSDQVMDCVSLREREKKNVERFLKRFAEEHS